MCVCVFVGVIEEKGGGGGGGKGGERKVTKHKHNKTRGWETFVNFTTCGSSVVKMTCIFRFTRVPTFASVFCACAALAYRIVITQSHSYRHKEQDMDAQP